jgi:hypothetical protein
MYIVQTVVRFLNQGQLQLFVGESMFELIVVDFSETGVCGELCGASDVVIFSVVCSVVIGASQTIRKTCEWSTYMYIVQTVVRFLNHVQLHLFVGGFMPYLRYLCLFAYSGIQHILLCCLLCSCSSCVLCA